MDKQTMPGVWHKLLTGTCKLKSLLNIIFVTKQVHHKMPDDGRHSSRNTIGCEELSSLLLSKCFIHSKMIRNIRIVLFFILYECCENCKLYQAATVAPSAEIGAGPGQPIPMEIPGYCRSLLPVLKYSNMSKY